MSGGPGQEPAGGLEDGAVALPAPRTGAQPFSDGAARACGATILARTPALLSLAQYRAHAARTLSRGPAGRDGQQPDLHHGAGPGAVLHGGAGAVHRLSHLLARAGRARALADRQPDSRDHCPPGAGLPDAVRLQGQPAGHGGLLHPGGHGHRADPDHRPHAQQHLARAPAAAAGPARADLLGCDHAGATGAGPEPGAVLLCDVGLARARQCLARRAALHLRLHRVPGAGCGHGGPVPLCAEHGGALAPCLGGGDCSWPPAWSWPRRRWGCTWHPCPRTR